MTAESAIAYCRDLRMRIDELTPWEIGFLGSLEAIRIPGLRSFLHCKSTSSAKFTRGSMRIRPED